MSAPQTTTTHRLTFRALSETFAIHRLPPATPVPRSVLDLLWFTVSRTHDELSLLVPTSYQLQVDAGIDHRIETPYRAFQIVGTLDFSLVGILADVATILKAVGIPIFVISTYDTDYVLVRADRADAARTNLVAAGHIVVDEQVGAKE
ncbi:amino acid-binding ACT domain-containing protein [Allomyces macrogynus ATCC 38327]|uniref:Amino acid-binding ACT domain-containing protein n=1 Tax=Allomyces macrogynus (strain ATCC 38327) TaxID=578462 RepID=A0A0L0SLR8_ALLM3|nr:amino acid-binding ACT domain-containing protein [Allomyces macrogynus ATCC 38327]|eukprot:KNE63413.1 amino acid-binding ACT domain-containing protein [Allomyces macrogynus ATCC 38327]